MRLARWIVELARSHPSHPDPGRFSFVGYQTSTPRGARIMAAKGKRIKIKLRSTESPYTYHKTKNARLHPERIEMKKYDPIAKKHVLFKETK
jgi:large subunit ribosomal protein L33